MTEGRPDMLSFLGVPADERLLDQDLVQLPDSEQYREPAISSRAHERLVAAGSLLTGTTQVGGAMLALFGGGELLLGDGGVLDVVLAVVGAVLVGTHWGWVHVAEYVGLTIDDRGERATDARRRERLAQIEPYPRFSVATRVLDDASTRVERFRHRPVLTAGHTFTFVREVDGEQTFDAHASAAVIAAGVETMRRQARLETDRLRDLWEAASTAYEASLLGAEDEQQLLAAQRAAATALSEHINASLLEAPLVE
jgi:hypothetical protein